MEMIYGITLIDSNVGMYSNDGRYRESETRLFRSSEDRDAYAIEWLKSYAKDLPETGDYFGYTLDDLLADFLKIGSVTINRDDYHLTFECFSTTIESFAH